MGKQKPVNILSPQYKIVFICFWIGRVVFMEKLKSSGKHMFFLTLICEMPIICTMFIG